MICASSRDRTKCQCLFYQIHEALSSAFSMLDLNPQKQTSAHPCSSFSPVDRMQANAIVQIKLYIDTLGSAYKTSLAGSRLQKTRKWKAWKSKT